MFYVVRFGTGREYSMTALIVIEWGREETWGCENEDVISFKYRIQYTFNEYMDHDPVTPDQ